MWSLVVASTHRETYTIEPYVDNYSRICKSVDKNSYWDLVHLYGVAATDGEGDLRIEMAKRNYGGGRVMAALLSDAEEEEEDVDAMEEAEDEVEGEEGGSITTTPKEKGYHNIKGVPIDSLGLPTDDDPHRPVLLKLDVEGHELRALLGGMQFLQRANIVYAMTELRPTFHTDEDTFASWKKIMGILVSKGLVPYRVDYEEETKLDVIRLHEWRHVKHPQVRYFDVVWRKDG